MSGSEPGRALIVGHAGQDGRILWDQLVKRGFSVAGVSRTSARALGLDHVAPVDVADARQVRELVERTQPTQVYYLAAHHHSSQDPGIHSSDAWEKSWSAQVHGLSHVLQALSIHAPGCRTFYASSSRVFGSAQVAVVSESTPLSPVDAYGVTKAAGMMLADYYRRVHRMHVSCGILFNHESPLRGPGFVTQRVVRGLVAVSRGEASTLELGSLGARVDWGYAPDFTRAMQLMLDLSECGDFVVATGVLHSVRDLVEIAASELGIDWTSCVVETGGVLERAPQGLRGDASRLRALTGWEPTVRFEEMVRLLVADASSS